MRFKFAGNMKINVIETLYEYREIVKQLSKAQGQDFETLILPYTHILRQTMAVNNVSEIPAMRIIAKTTSYQESLLSQMFFIAACVESLDPGE